MTAHTRTSLIALALLTVGTTASIGLTAGAGKPFSHAQHMEEGAECDTCHKAGAAEKPPVLNRAGCEECHDDGTPAWVLPGKASDLGATFPHTTHAEAGECKDCHAKTLDGSHGAGTALLDSGRCFACHAENEVEIGAEACGKCHSDRPAPAARVPMGALLFPHQVHAEASDCTGCHKVAAAGQHPIAKPKLGFDDCSACHQENGVDVTDSRCTACHGRDMTKVAPADHAHAWQSRHGREADWRRFDRHGQDCSLCHRNDSCQACHRTRRPRSHTGLWRNRTHGVQAGWDRQACQTCHETGTCIRCHRTTEPLNHKGAWRSTHGLAAQTRSNEHCAVCHQLSWCAACHAGR